MTSRLWGLWQGWVDLCSAREAPLTLAIVRMAVAVILLWDLAWIAALDLPVLLWAPEQAGGAVDVYQLSHVPPVYWLLPESSAAIWGGTVAWALWVGCVLSLSAFATGLATRSSGLLFVLLYAQTAWINDTADRGIDRMLRIVLLLLVVSGCGRTLSLDARWRTGSWWGDGRTISALPRMLIIGQLLLMYWCAGVEKFALSWFPWGDYTALYLILQDPILGVHDGGWYALPVLLQLTQLGTAVSHLWEWTAPFLLLIYWFRNTRTRGGRLRACSNANDVRMWYLAIGVVFHIALAGTLRLGIFPLAMLALYPAFIHPAELGALFRRALAGLRFYPRRESTHAPVPR